MLTKGMGYWADGEAVKTAATMKPQRRTTFQPTKDGQHAVDGWAKPRILRDSPDFDGGTSANRRNVWRDIKPKPYPGQHFAVFPPDLPRICIQASTSEVGCCPVCGNQITRVVQTEAWTTRPNSGGQRGGIPYQREAYIGQSQRGNRYATSDTLSWCPSCTHQEAIDSPEPCLVLDPFIGSGTTALAAVDLNRRAVGIDLSLEYLESAKMRIITTGKLPLDNQTRV